MAKLFKGVPPFWQCPSPKCKGEKFGVLGIHDQSYTRRCNDCDFDQTFQLPQPRKKILYLDQFAISLLVKVSLGRTPKADKWVKLRETIDRAIKAQAIICPHSELHERESWFDHKLGAELAKFYRRISLGRSFRSSFEIQSAQIHDALRTFEQDSTSCRWPRWHYFLRKDPDVWHDLIFMNVNTDKSREKALAKQAKVELTSSAAELTMYFRQSNKTFDEQYRLEVRQQATNIVQIWTRQMRKMAACQTSQEWVEAHLFGSIYSDTMNQIMRFYGQRGLAGEIMAERMKDFLFSSTFEEIDVVRLAAALWAGIARKVFLKEGGVRASDSNDVEMISHYAPYCDAMLVDRRMKGLLTTNPVKNKIGLETKFFSAIDLDELIAYLNELINQVPTEVAAKAKEVYGP